ncbi:MAG: HAD family phosphatase [Bacillota bacterium]|nr:HAD family phosphatase [Bacillota bacterium]
MNKRFAIFDMDGTLVDSMGYWRRLGREYLLRQGLNEDIAPALERVRSLTMGESAVLFVEEFHLPKSPEKVAAEMNSMMEAHYRQDIPLKAGVELYLQRLRERGCRLCVASATDSRLMQDCLRRLSLEGCFEFLLSCQEVGENKRSPLVYLEAARRLGAAPGEIAVYEDALYAAETAKAAGFYTLGVYDAVSRESWAQLTRLTDEWIMDWAEAAAAL